jgi:RNA polymerase sigma-70 factor (ECF subfamily)
MYNLEQVYKENKRYIYNLCFRYTKNKEVAEDITQDTFLKFHLNGNFKENSSLKTYISRIAINMCIDHYKKPKFETITDVKEVALSDNYSDLMDIVSQVNDNDLNLLKSKYIDGIEFKDLAKIHGCSISAMKMRVKRLKDGLVKKYSENYL